MIVSDAPHFIYVRVPKTGSTSLSSALERYARPKPLGKLGAVLRRLPLPDRLYGRVMFYRAEAHLSLWGATRFLGPDYVARAFKFSMVRHPVDRLISLHKHMLRTPEAP